MIDFLRYRFVGAFISIAFLGAGVASYVYHGGFRYSVDFTGGTQVRFKFSKPVGSEAIKEALASGGWEDALIREFGSGEVAVRVKEFANDSQGLAQKIKTILTVRMSDDNVTILEANAVGAGVGKSLRFGFLMALSLGMLLILLYIAIRFWSISYGAGTVLGLIHDALAIGALIALLQIEVSPNVIMATLAVLGYSVNDTIVIFAKMRELFKKATNSSAYEVVNLSINQTLRRTILLSFATMLVVVPLYIYGGEALHNFSLVFLFGIVLGTYSSIYVASPIMLLLRK